MLGMWPESAHLSVDWAQAVHISQETLKFELVRRDFEKKVSKNDIVFGRQRTLMVNVLRCTNTKINYR